MWHILHLSSKNFLSLNYKVFFFNFRKINIKSSKTKLFFSSPLSNVIKESDKRNHRQLVFPFPFSKEIDLGNFQKMISDFEYVRTHCISNVVRVIYAPKIKS